MPAFRQHSTRLERGTLVMFHEPAMWLRYRRIERLIDVESTSILLAGAGLLLAGGVRASLLFFIAGAAVFVAGVITWSIRRLRHLKQRSESPRMIFISDEGVSAALPGLSTVRMRWNGITAREFRNLRGSLPGKRRVADRAMRGMMLKNAIGQRIYITNDLDGYKEFLEILVELDVPVQTAGGTFKSSKGSFADWRRNAQ